jgi:hypothetical protein
VPVEQRLDRAETLEVGVDVDPALAPEDLQAENVGALGRRAEALGRLGPAQVAGRSFSVQTRSSQPGLCFVHVRW